uniref:Uncharacterized protein n=1 Tax=Triticum urartu TaxID=4572 RepID=A0A8R7UQQ1_TRIUA
MPHNDHIFSGILKLNRKRAEKRWPNLMQMGHAGEASLGPAWLANWIRSKRPGPAIPSQHPSPILTTDAGVDCHGRSAVSPATRGETTTRAERRRASRWRPEKAAPEDSREGVPARLGTGEDAYGRSA